MIEKVKCCWCGREGEEDVEIDRVYAGFSDHFELSCQRCQILRKLDEDRRKLAWAKAEVEGCTKRISVYEKQLAEMDSPNGNN